MTSLHQILTRLEAAEGADRELDALVFKLFDDKWNSGPPHVPVPYTASIDAALGLAEREYPEEAWALWKYSDGDFDVQLLKNSDSVALVRNARTAPLAILTALIKAKIAEGRKALEKVDEAE